MWLPFACLGLGALLSRLMTGWSDRLMHYSLLLLLMGLGIRIGSERDLMAAIPTLGARAVVLCLLASALSILVVLVWEKAFLPHGLHQDPKPDCQGNGLFSQEGLFILSVFLFLTLGIGLGRYLSIPANYVQLGIMAALVCIYTSIGVGLKEGINSLKVSTNKMAYLIVPILILLASLAGGLLGSWLMPVKPSVAGSIGSGVAYYSLTAAMITQKSGVEWGIVAFLANFLREVVTFFLTPMLRRVSYLAPIALGGASTMDTTLAVMKRFLGEEYAVFAFISGTVLTLLVPILLLAVLGIDKPPV